MSFPLHHLWRRARRAALRPSCFAVAACSLALFLLGSHPARAADADAAAAPPPNTVRAGLYALFYHVSAYDLSGPYVPPGVNLDVQNVQTLYLAYVRRFGTHIDLEFAFGYPPLTKTVGRGPARLGSVPFNGEVISSARWFAPSLNVNYVFGDNSRALRPYIGVGVISAHFYARNSTAAGNAASGGPTHLSLTPSIGAVGLVGLSYRWSPRWSAYASYSFSDVHTDLTANTAGIIRTTHISFNPQALVVSIGFSF